MARVNNKSTAVLVDGLGAAGRFDFFDARVSEYGPSVNRPLFMSRDFFHGVGESGTGPMNPL